MTGNAKPVTSYQAHGEEPMPDHVLLIALGADPNLILFETPVEEATDCLDQSVPALEGKQASQRGSGIQGERRGGSKPGPAADRVGGCFPQRFASAWLKRRSRGRQRVRWRAQNTDSFRPFKSGASGVRLRPVGRSSRPAGRIPARRGPECGGSDSENAGISHAIRRLPARYRHP